MVERMDEVLQVALYAATPVSSAEELPEDSIQQMRRQKEGVKAIRTKI